MELLKPRRLDTVKEEYEVSKPTRFILDAYGKYTKYPEGEILDHLVLQLLKEDYEFVKWISKQRTNKKFFQHGLLEHLSEEQQQLFEPYSEEDISNESDEEISL
ncbi:hypothetical protein [Turicibacter sanguinis]|uniref:hypothetical protein n=1 Tax=Turicibacter sanguinis TaxID=154288 RepID=UPI0018A015BC|nr:hypothetical protein [Turicibacter sanguinis]